MISEPSCAACGNPMPEASAPGAVCEKCATAAESQNTTTATDSTRAPRQVDALPSAVRLPAAVGGYEILDKLGQGGMGAVYRARQTTLGSLVALKILPGQFEDDEDYVARFQREARVAAGLDHPNLVRVLDSGEADGCHFIAMELVEGENLQRRLKRGGPLAPAEAVRICLAVARALQCGWGQARLIHRDVKPGNIYLAADGVVKLGDLGLAKSLLGQSTGVTLSGAAIGTPHYISPEQAKGEKTADFRADFYSLGCTLYQCLTGTTPYRATDALTVMSMHVSAPPPQIRKVMPHCPERLARTIGRLLKKNRDERPASHEELIAELEEIARSLEQNGGIGVLDQPTQKRAARRIALAAGMLTVGAIAFVPWHSKPARKATPSTAGTFREEGQATPAASPIPASPTPNPAAASTRYLSAVTPSKVLIMMLNQEKVAGHVLIGNFIVTSALPAGDPTSRSTVILRSTDSLREDVRVVINYPPGMPLPREKEVITLTGSHLVEIKRAEKSGRGVHLEAAMLLPPPSTPDPPK